MTSDSTSADAGKPSGGLGVGALTTGARDMTLAAQAILERWPVSNSAAAALVGRLEAAVIDPETKPRALYAAVRALLAIRRLNLSAISTAIAAEQHEQLAQRIEKIESQLKSESL